MMKKKFNNQYFLSITAVATMAITLMHGFSPSISIFHGFVIHPIFITLSLILLWLLERKLKKGER
jgi:hypothetical protein